MSNTPGINTKQCPFCSTAKRHPDQSGDHMMVTGYVLGYLAGVRVLDNACADHKKLIEVATEVVVQKYRMRPAKG